MTTSTSHSAAKSISAITPAQREVIRDLIGVPVEADQKLFIMTYSSGVAPSSADKEQAAKEALRLLAEAHENIRKSGATETEIAEALDEAIQAGTK